MSAGPTHLYWPNQTIPLNIYYCRTKTRVERPLQPGDVIRKKLSYKTGGLWFYGLSIEDRLEGPGNVLGNVAIWNPNAKSAAEQGDLLVSYMVLEDFTDLSFDDLELVETYTLEEMLLHENGQIRLAGRYFNGETQPILR